MMLGSHIAKDVDEILLGYICAKYNIVVMGFITTNIRRNSVPYRSSEMCHFVCTNAVPPNLFNVLFQCPIVTWPIILNQIIQQTGFFLWPGLP